VLYSPKGLVDIYSESVHFSNQVQSQRFMEHAYPTVIVLLSWPSLRQLKGIGFIRCIVDLVDETLNQSLGLGLETTPAGVFNVYHHVFGELEFSVSRRLRAGSTAWPSPELIQHLSPAFLHLGNMVTVLELILQANFTDTPIRFPHKKLGLLFGG
jgi:hypothetical protein